MASRRRRDALQRLRDAVMDQAYVLTPHAMFEMREDRLDVLDVESAILTGSIVRTFENDPRGTRYEIVGRGCDLTTPIGVVAREAGRWIIITVYEIRG